MSAMSALRSSLRPSLGPLPSVSSVRIERGCTSIASPNATSRLNQNLRRASRLGHQGFDASGAGLWLVLGDDRVCSRAIMRANDHVGLKAQYVLSFTKAPGGALKGASTKLYEIHMLGVFV